MILNEQSNRANISGKVALKKSLVLLLVNGKQVLCWMHEGVHQSNRLLLE
jgi:hypothetical protein